jgi:ubiquinone/menaquinone biosynthesis C-methylase UbiE
MPGGNPTGTLHNSILTLFLDYPIDPMAKILEYTELAPYYDLFFSHTKDYKAESEEIRRLIARYKKSDGNALLDVGCGTGRHLRYLKRWYGCTGTDLNQEMLNIAKRTVSGVRFKKANMMDLRMPDRFDAITCLFSAIGYVRTYGNLERTIRNFHGLLKPGGVLIIDGWFDRREWLDGSVHIMKVDAGRTKIVKVGFSSRRGPFSRAEEHWLIAEKGRETRHFVDRQEMGLFEKDRFMEILRARGFRARILKSPMPGRPRYLAVRQALPPISPG